jgi:uncharacterized protein
MFKYRIGVIVPKFGRFTPAAVPLVALAIAAGAVVDNANAQGADCRAIGPAANVICSDPVLAGLNAELSNAFRGVVESSQRELRPSLIRQQSEWSGGLGQCLSGADPRECLRQAYEARIAEMDGNAAVGNAGLGSEGGFAGQIPVERAELPPPPPPSGTDGATAPSEAAEIAAAPGTAGSGTAAANNSGAGSNAGGTNAGADVGEFRSAATGSAAVAPDGSDTAAILTSTVWKAEVASGIRPGTIFIFQDDGALVTADCVESYRLGTWKLGDDGTLALTGAGTAGESAQIVSIRDRFVRLNLGSAGNLASALVLRPALAPFSCKNG